MSLTFLSECEAHPADSVETHRLGDSKLKEFVNRAEDGKNALSLVLEKTTA